MNQGINRTVQLLVKSVCPTHELVLLSEVDIDEKEQNKELDPGATFPRRSSLIFNPKKRFIALVKDGVSGEGCIVVFKRPIAPSIVTIIPVTASVEPTIKQLTDTKSDLTQRTRFSIEIASTTASFEFSTENVELYSPLLAAIKELKRTAPISPTTRWSRLYKDEEYKRRRTASIQASVMSLTPALSLSAIQSGLAVLNETEPEPKTHQANWLNQLMKEQVAQYTTEENLRIFCGTFNVDDKVASDADDLSPWLKGALESDVLVFGFQEFDLSAEAMMRYTSYREDMWRIAIDKALMKLAQASGKETHDFVKIASKQNVTTLIILYVRKELAGSVRNVQKGHISTGMLGIAATKGAVSLRLKIKGTTFVFIASHLAAHEKFVDKRNVEFKEISRFMLFQENGEHLGQTVEEPEPLEAFESDKTLASLGYKGRRIWETDHLFWLGDLNYRLVLPRRDVLNLIEQKAWTTLQLFDQLAIQQSHDLAFHKFHEPPINFPPTYKFNPGTDIYDTSEKMRVPSYTDRVLYRTKDHKNLKCLSYDPAFEIKLSDHKPLKAIFEALVRTRLANPERELRSRMRNEIKKYETKSKTNMETTALHIEPEPSVQFEEVVYDVPQTRELTLANVSELICPWSFSNRPNASGISSSWLAIFPTTGVLLPGHTIKVTFTLHVTSQVAVDLNFDPRAILEDVLILSIQGRDMFITIQTGKYLRTCFGNELSRLARLDRPIRQTALEDLGKITRGEDLENSDGAASLPKEIWRLVGFLAEWGTDEETLFLHPGEAELVSQIRDCLDNGDEFPIDKICPSNSERPLLPTRSSSSWGFGFLTRQTTASSFEDGPVEPEIKGINSIATCLVQLLTALPIPLIDFDSNAALLKLQTREDAYAIIEDLPIIYGNTLLYIVSFLRVLVGKTVDLEQRLARIERLALIFSPALMRPTLSLVGSVTASDMSALPRQRRKFMLCLLTDEGELEIS